MYKNRAYYFKTNMLLYFFITPAIINLKSLNIQQGEFGKKNEIDSAKIYFRKKERARTVVSRSFFLIT